MSRNFQCYQVFYLFIHPIFMLLTKTWVNIILCFIHSVHILNTRAQQHCSWKEVLREDSSWMWQFCFINFYKGGESVGQIIHFFFLNSSSHKPNPLCYSFTNKQTKEKTVIARHQGYPTIPPPTSFRLHVAFRLQSRSTHCVTSQFTTAHVVYVTAWPLSVSRIHI